jgi:hypothetical protein
MSDTLIARLARELYDLKQKLEDIRNEAEEIYNNTSHGDPSRLHAINIINNIDVTEIYESPN